MGGGGGGEEKRKNPYQPCSSLSGLLALKSTYSKFLFFFFFNNTGIYIYMFFKSTCSLLSLCTFVFAYLMSYSAFLVISC